MPDETYLTGDDAILKRIREFRDYSWSRSSKNRTERTADIRALSVTGPWPQAELDARQSKENPRPHGHTDIITPYNNRIVNQARMNPRGVEVVPKGMGADAKTAEKRENRIRGIDYESKASSADLTALKCAVDGGIGYERVDIDFESPKSRNLKIVVKRVANVESVLDDPDCEEADRSDRKQLLICQWIRKGKAKQRWKKLKDATIESFSADDLGASAAWRREDSMMFAEYWEVEEKPERLVFFAGSVSGEFVSDLEKKGATVEDDHVVTPDGQIVPIDNEREGTRSKVMQYFTNGLQIFERKPWPGSWIPFPTCTGPEYYLEGELVTESMTRKLREPQLNFDVATAGEMEQFGMATKSKIMVSDKAIEGYEDQWKMAHRNPQAFLKYHERDEQGQPVTQPKEIMFQAQIQGYEEARNSYIRDAQNAAGMSGVDQKQRQGESGIAQEKIDEAADISSFHFIDSYLAMIEFRGRIENELLTIIEDSQRTVGFRSKDGTYKADELTPVENEDGSIQHPYGEGDAHGVTIATGPNYQSQQQEAKDFAETLAKVPAFALPLGPLIIELKQLGVTGDKMKKVLTALLPGPVAAAYADDENGQEPTPPHAQQAIQKAQQDLQSLNQHAKQLEQQVIELTDDLKAQKIQAESREHIAQREIDARWKEKCLDAYVKLRSTEITASKDADKQDVDVIASRLEQMAEHSHDIGMAALEHQQTLEQGQQAGDLAAQAAAAPPNGNGAQG